MVKTFQKKPVRVEAVHYAFNRSNRDEILGFDPNIESNWDNDPRTPEKLTIRTLEGRMTISPGDWVIRGIAGEVYPCKPAIFDKTYEEVHP